MHADEFTKDISRFKRKISRPKSIFDVIDSIHFFSKSHQGRTRAQQLLFEEAKEWTLEYISLFGLKLGTKFPASPQGKNKIWREQIMPMLGKAREMTCKEKDAARSTPNLILPGKEGIAVESKLLKNKPAKTDQCVSPHTIYSHRREQERQASVDALSTSGSDRAVKSRKTRALLPQYYTVLPEWIIKTVSRRNAFEMLPRLIVEFAIDHRDIFGLWLQMPAKESFENKPQYTQNLYLALCELNDHIFYKVGLTKHKDPLRRDPNVYKRVIYCHEVDNVWAHIYESYCLWRCKQIRGKQPWDVIEFGWWAGKSEMVRSADKAVERLFNDAYSEISKASKKLEVEQVYFEWYLLDRLINAIYDERYTTSALSVYRIAQKIVNHFSECHGDPDDYLIVELHPAASNYLSRRLNSQLAPIVDRKWDQHNIREPLSRYHMGKRLYEEWCYETWGEKCWSSAKPYRNMITDNLYDDALKSEAAKFYGSRMYKVFASDLPAQKPPQDVAALKYPILPEVQKKPEPKCAVEYPETLTVVYEDIHGDITTREISILSETLHTLDAFCHLRQENRTFNIWNIQSVLLDNGSKCWGPRFFHDLRMGTYLDMKKHLSLDIKDYEEAAKMAALVINRKQLAALEERSLKAWANISKVKSEAAHDKAHRKWEVLQKAYVIASEKKYDAQYRPILTSRNSLSLTLFQLSHAYRTVSVGEHHRLRRMYPQLSNKDDWETFKGDDAPCSDTEQLEALRFLVKFRRIIEHGPESDRNLEAIDSLAYSQPAISNNYFNLRGSKKPSEQWLRLAQRTRQAT